MRSIFLTLIGLAVGSQAQAGLIFESATAVVTSTRNDTGIAGAPIAYWGYEGGTFRLNSETRITSIGGHFFNYNFFGSGNNEIFGAILAASSLSAIPSMANVAGNALAVTLIRLPTSAPGLYTSDTLSGSVDVTLGPGFYSVVFGSGLFGATGTATSVETVNGSAFSGAVNSGGVSTFGMAQTYYQAASVTAPGFRYFVNGTPVAAAVPEPSSLLLLTLGLSGAGVAATRSRRA